MRKNRTLKADDLLPLDSASSIPSSVRTKSEAAVSHSKGALKAESTEKAAAKISLKDIDFGIKKKDDGELSDDDGEIKNSNSEESDDEEFLDIQKLNKDEEKEELQRIMDEENNALDELHTILSKTRKKMTAPVVDIKQEVELENKTNDGVDLDRFVLNFVEIN